MDSFQQRSTQNIILRLLSLFFLLIIRVDMTRGHNIEKSVSIPDLGILQGLYNTHTEITSFLGIPYARPPIGDLRFLLPQTIYWNGTKTAKMIAPACFQIVSNSSMPVTPVSEDCLYLNVYIPGNMTDLRVNRSVMVWIHGGDFTSGYADDYNVNALVREGDIIVVTINYRLNIFGFLTASNPVQPGNAGLHDQVMALKWVKTNIGSFGGDPEKITIFGQSAGAVSIYVLLASPNITNGLFARAVMLNVMIPSVTTPVTAFDAIANLTSCPHIHTHGGTHAGAILNQIKCMRNKTSLELLAVATDPRAPKFGPVIDNMFLKSTTLKQLAASKSSVPCLIGFNNHEFVWNTNESIENLDALKKRLSSLGSQSFDSMAVQFMISKFLTSDLEKTYMDAFNSQIMALHHNLAITLSKTTHVFLYYFTHHPSFIKTNKYNVTLHSVEVPFVFGDMSSATPDEEVLSKDMIHIWSSFARDG